MRYRVTLSTKENQIRHVVIVLLEIGVMDTQVLGGTAFLTMISVAFMNELPNFVSKSW
jgi:hypothetical protein